MPYIVLATASIPDGTLQVTDLHPNTSSRHLTTDPPGQSKYINRCENSVPSINATTGATALDVRGVSAYIQSHVQPCGGEQPWATVTLAGVLANDTVTIAGVPFTALTNAAADPAAQEFDRTPGTNITAATNLVAAINDAASQLLLNAALVVGSITASNVGGTSAVVTLTYNQRGTSTTLLNATLASISAVRLLTSGAYLTLTNQVPTEAEYAVAAAAIIARVDAGLALTLSDVNVSLTASFVGSTVLGGGFGSTGTVADLLGILAGRGFKLDAGTTLFTRPLTSPLFAAVAGSFTSSGLVNGTTFVDGEWVPSTLGGDAVTLELKPIRHTYESASLAVSKQLGQLSVLSSFTGTLFPDSDGNIFIPSTYQKSAGHQAPETPSRLVTVYNDDGSLYT